MRAAAEVCYTFNQLTSDTFDQVTCFVCEENIKLDCADINTFLKRMRMAYDDPDRVRTAAIKII